MSVTNAGDVEQELPIDASDGGGGGVVGGTENVDGAKTEVPASAGVGSQSSVYGPEEIATLRGIFGLCDVEHTGTVAVRDLDGILQKVGHSPGEPVVKKGENKYILRVRLEPTLVRHSACLVPISLA